MLSVFQRREGKRCVRATTGVEYKGVTGGESSVLFPAGEKRVLGTCLIKENTRDKI